jgi:FkbM family methyltransferase
MFFKRVRRFIRLVALTVRPENVRKQLWPPREVVIDAVVVPIGPQISRRVRTYMFAGAYERDEATILKSRLRPGDVVLVLGGGIGFTATICAKLLGSDNVFVYEANPGLETPARELFARNGVAPTLTMCGLAPRDGTLEFLVAKDFWTSRAAAIGGLRNATRVTVPIRAFQPELDRLNRRPNVLVIDIEGSEVDFFEAVDLTGFTKVVCETHPHFTGRTGVARLVARLAAQGLVLDRATSRGDVLYFAR